MTDNQNTEEPVQEINVEYVFIAIEKAREKDRYKMLSQALNKFPKEGQEVAHFHSRLLGWVVAKDKVGKSPSRQQRQLRKLALQFLANLRVSKMDVSVSREIFLAVWRVAQETSRRSQERKLAIMILSDFIQYDERKYESFFLEKSFLQKLEKMSRENFVKKLFLKERRMLFCKKKPKLRSSAETRMTPSVKTARNFFKEIADRYPNKVFEACPHRIDIIEASLCSKANTCVVVPSPQNG